MIDWNIWLVTGIEHILDIYGYDHMLFMTLLAMLFTAREWKKLLGLITAFTLGHSITLALSAIDVIKIQSDLIEFIIVLTIAITSAFQLFYTKNTANRGKVIYAIIACFGLIHGIGFSYLLKSMLGHEENIIVPLLMFNLGLEIGQVLFVSLVTVILVVMSNYFASIEKTAKTLILGLIFVVSIFLCFERFLNIINP